MKWISVEKYLPGDSNYKIVRAICIDESISYFEAGYMLSWKYKDELISQKIRKITHWMDPQEPINDCIHCKGSGKENKNNIKNMELYFNRVDEIEFTTRTASCLRAENFIFLGDIICNKKLYGDFGRLKIIPNFGQKSFIEVMDYLREINFIKPIECPEYWMKRKVLTDKPLPLE